MGAPMLTWAVRFQDVRRLAPQASIDSSLLPQCSPGVESPWLGPLLTHRWHEGRVRNISVPGMEARREAH